MLSFQSLNLDDCIFIQDLVDKGDAIYCPNCQVLLLKKWGCDWLKCTYCKTEICWVTRQRRWGPNVRSHINFKMEHDFKLIH